MLNVNQTSQVLQFLNDAKRIVTMTHANPDGDALGSMLGLAAILRENLRKEVICVCKDPAPPPFQFLPGVSTIRQEFTAAPNDLFLFLDAAEPKQTDFQMTYHVLFSLEEQRKQGIHSIKIDHHPTESDFAMLNLVDPTAASSAEVVVDIADGLNFTIPRDAATCLLTGMYTDTGSMMHSNTTARVYRTAARLIQRGADRQAIIENVFRSSRVSTLKLWGRVLEKISLTEEGAAISAVTAGDFRATGADFSELTGAIDYVNSIPGMKFSLVLSERGGKVKGSLRTLRDDVDVSALAQKFAGGGHKKAAGFSLEGKLEEETRWKVIPPSEGNSKNQIPNSTAA